MLALDENVNGRNTSWTKDAAEDEQIDEEKLNVQKEERRRNGCWVWKRWCFAL